MPSCAFLTTDDLEGFVTDDELAHGPLRELGWSVEPVSWRRGTDWRRFDAVVVRSTWDYQADPAGFEAVLERIDRSTQLFNALGLIRWNLHKSYLRDLESRGVPIVPSLFAHGMEPDTLASLFAHLDAEELVIKPAVSANADDAFRLTPTRAEEQGPELRRRFRARDFLAQPFERSVVDEGEFSLFFFARQHSHTILKRPRRGDFRVQEEHGGQIRSVEAPAALRAAAQRAIDAVTPEPLYARVDLVRREPGTFVVMELELIEPALYFRMDAGAARRFAAALDARFAGPR